MIKLAAVMVMAAVVALAAQIASAQTLSLSGNGAWVRADGTSAINFTIGAVNSVGGSVPVTLTEMGPGVLSPTSVVIAMTATSSGSYTGSAPGRLTSTTTPGTITVTATAPGFPSAQATYTTVAYVPAVPSNLNASAVSASQVNLTWTNNANNAQGVLIERAVGAGSFSQIASVGAVSSYSDAGLSKKTGYSYRVRAFNTAGNSGYSNTASATTPNH